MTRQQRDRHNPQGPSNPCPPVRILLALAVLLLAGCVSAPPPAAVAPAAVSPATMPFEVPQPDGARAAAWHAEFVTTYIHRETYAPNNWLASEFLRSELAAAGWEVQQSTWAPTGLGLPVDSGVGINAVVGVKQGKTDAAVIGFIGHYDTVPTTIQGAYDNGAGTAALMELARAFADYDNDKTLMVVFFDSEELGLVASDYFVQQAVANEKARWHLVLGHDMVGINWPGHAWSLDTYPDEAHLDLLKPVEERLYHEVLGWPVEGVVVKDEYTRSSDEIRFKDAGVPILRLAGGPSAGDYPQYHMPLDTVEFIHEFVGGEANWVAGFGASLNASAWNIALFDHLPHPEDPAFPAAARALLDQLAAARPAPSP